MKRMQRHSFTIMELMGVLIIMSLMMAIAVGSLNVWRDAGGVDTGAQMLSTQVRLARQYAITHRKRVAVLLPEETFDQTWDSPGDVSDMAYRANSFRACIVDDTDTFTAFIPNTNWSFIPPTAVFESATNTTTLVDVEFMQSSASSTELKDVRGIIFKPDGSLTATSNVAITLVQGAVLGTSIHKSASDNKITCTINWLTGAITFSKD